MSKVLHKWCRIKTGPNEKRVVFALMAAGLDHVVVTVPEAQRWPLQGDVEAVSYAVVNIEHLTPLDVTPLDSYRLAVGEMTMAEVDELK